MSRAETVVRMLRREADGAASHQLVEITPPLIRELADLIERMEAVVEAARAFHDRNACVCISAYLDGKKISQQWCELGQALAALDVVTPAPKNSNTTTRSCPNAVSFCAGPDRYGDTCAACLATWTEEAKEKK